MAYKREDRQGVRGKVLHHDGGVANIAICDRKNTKMRWERDGGLVRNTEYIRPVMMCGAHVVTWRSR